MAYQQASALGLRFLLIAQLVGSCQLFMTPKLLQFTHTCITLAPSVDDLVQHCKLLPVPTYYEFRVRVTSGSNGSDLTRRRRRRRRSRLACRGCMLVGNNLKERRDSNTIYANHQARLEYAPWCERGFEVFWETAASSAMVSQNFSKISRARAKLASFGDPRPEHWIMHSQVHLVLRARGSSRWPAFDSLLGLLWSKEVEDLRSCN